MSEQLALFEAQSGRSPIVPDRPKTWLKVATWNVNGIRAREAQLHAWLAEEAPDVVCLQEIKANPSQIPASLCELPGYACRWHGEGGYSGVALHVRRVAFDDEPAFDHPPFDFENRMVTATMGSLTMASVYVPNGGKDFEAKMRFFEALDGWVADLLGRGGSLILCGDLNVARAEIDVHPKERKPNKAVIGQLPEERALFERLLSHGMVDVARTLAPDDEGLFTWWAPWRNLRQRNIGWRIDYIVASRNLADHALSCEVRAAVGTSDHAPVVAVFERGG
jgi:exodeoxyribonuclease-3